MVTARRVLVVDGLSETEQVLKAVLEPRGLEVNRIRGSRNTEAQDDPPGVIVLHEDGPNPEVPHPEWSDVPRVVIGPATGGNSENRLLREERLQKPFQYGELIAAIERLLDFRANAA